jgi:hypothetical protein
MADRKITDLTALAAGGQATGDLVTIVDVSESAAADKNKKMTMENLFKGIPGDVGIGTSTPSSYGSAVKLAAVSASNTALSIASGTSDDGTLFFADGTSGDATYRGSVKYSHSSDAMQFSTAASERMRIDSSGNVGIGATSPASPLHISSSEDRLLLLQSSDANAYLALQDSDSSSNAANRIGTVSDGLYFNTGGGGERMRIDSSGRLLINTSSEISSSTATGSVHIVASGGGKIYMMRDDSGSTVAGNDLGMIRFYSNDGGEQESARIEAEADLDHGTDDKPGRLVFSTTADGASSPTERMRIDSNGDVGIGTTSPALRLHVQDSDSQIIRFSRTGTGAGSLDVDSSGNAVFNSHTTSKSVVFHTQATERARITSSGQLLVGASSAISAGNSQYALFQTFGNTAGATGDARVVLGRGEAATAMNNNTNIGQINFTDNAGGEFAQIQAVADAAPGTDDFPGRLVFKTCADGASSPTERLRIDSAGNLLHNSTVTNPGAGNTSTGTCIEAASDGGTVLISRGNNVPLYLNRNTDGILLLFNEDGNNEGSVSVSGTTVSYNGGHLSRWSQLAGGAERIEILRGSVLSNIDEMCEWGEEDNEQLNRMKVSDVEGDVNVSGVFQAWDDDDDTYTNDFYCAMTGDFIIRIAQDTTVARGDLLMSAGDGTAKPQDDDIVRSKTIAKVTSTTVSTTYADGSYCVPCVLMAC